VASCLLLTLRVNQFLEGVRNVERHRIQLVSRIAEGNPFRLPGLATEIVAQKVDVLFAAGPAAVRAAHSVAQGPVVGLDLETDPVQSGLVSSLSRPGGTLTGVFFDFPDFSTKWLELLREVLPQLSRLAVLWDPSTGTIQLNAVEKAATSMGLNLQVIRLEEAGNLPEAVRTAKTGNAEALLLLSSPMFGSHPATSARIAFDILPTADTWERADKKLATAFWPWSLLAPPEPLPERLVSAAPDAVVDDALGGWGSPANAFGPEVRAAYIKALRDPARVHAICEEYRAAATLDHEHDLEDRHAGRCIACPVLVLWSGRDPLGAWYAEVGGPLAYGEPGQRMSVAGRSMPVISFQRKFRNKPRPN
jgi:ABC transporter substrate binding protein